MWNTCDNLDTWQIWDNWDIWETWEIWETKWPEWHCDKAVSWDAYASEKIVCRFAPRGPNLLKNLYNFLGWRYKLLEVVVWSPESLVNMFSHISDGESLARQHGVKYIETSPGIYRQSSKNTIFVRDPKFYPKHVLGKCSHSWSI